jgi:hypothetical protein
MILSGFRDDMSRPTSVTLHFLGCTILYQHDDPE